MKNHFALASLTSIAFAAIAASTGILVVGALDPSTGPVAPTLATRSEPEPRTPVNAATCPGDDDATPSQYKIAYPGSYYLTGNIVGAPGRAGIEIASSGVSLDLCGFELTGSPGSFDAIRVTTAARGGAIRNGVLRAWGGDGLDASSAHGLNIENLRAIQNAQDGLITGDSAVLARCSATDNGLSGIRAGAACVVQACAASNNGQHGVVVGTGGVLTDCASFFNSGNGLDVAHHAIVRGCAASNNALSGIRCLASALLRDNVCNVNGAAGIYATLAGNRIEGNDASGNHRGIDADAGGNIIIRNRCSGNAVNWTLAQNNILGPIIDHTAVAAGAVHGNAAAGSLGSGDPNANYSN